MPLDPGYPAERLTYMLSDCAPVAVLTHGLSEEVRGTLVAAVGSSTPLIDLDTDAARWSERSTTNLRREEIGLAPEHLAYVIYTSGSTGQPKGGWSHIAEW